MATIIEDVMFQSKSKNEKNEDWTACNIERYHIKSVTSKVSHQKCHIKSHMSHQKRHIKSVTSKASHQKRHIKSVTSKASHQKRHIKSVTSKASHQKRHIKSVTSKASHQKRHIKSVTSKASHQKRHIKSVTSKASHQKRHIKIFEKLIFSRVSTYLIKNKLIYNKQFGFRTNYSTNHALISITEHICGLLDTGYVCGIFVDLEKAFDTVNKNILCEKLNHYGLRGNINKLIRSYLDNRRQYVSLNGFDSEIKM